MANVSRNFVAGKMNKSVDERLVPNGEYIDALNCRLGSTEESEIGAIENSKGNLPLTALSYNGTLLSSNARCIGALEDGANETIYWFVHDPSFSIPGILTGKLDLIVSFNTQTNTLTYHIISIDDGFNINTTLNFNPSYLITGVNLVDSNQEGLLFFTDDYNPPRVINIRRTYDPPLSPTADGFTAESILVIKQPPLEAPIITPLITGGEQNFLEDRFICFAYRYKYADNEYSATSQFTEPSFIPKPFAFSRSSFLNEGMVNSTNAVKIDFNSGGPLVKQVELLYKEASNNVIKVIQKFDNLNPNTTLSYIFQNDKIFTILPESEILRLYDNVPLLAKAQTIMGNRLMYGNYVEGYDLIDKFSNSIQLTYFPTLISTEINLDDLTTATAPAVYNINGPQTIADGQLFVDLSSVATELKAGAQINITVRFSHSLFTGNTPFPTQQTQNVEIEWSYILTIDYASVYALATSQEFQDAVGTISNIKPVYDPVNPTSCDGFTFTDFFNCALPNTLNGTTPVTKYASGISAPGQPILIGASPSSNIIQFTFPVMNYVGNVNNPTAFSVYEYYKIVGSSAEWAGLATPSSLHSNRGYEIGIVYMDDFNRSSTALVSPNNTVNVPCSACNSQNGIRVTIPVSQRAPYWAKRYKFVIRADRENYETIYAVLYFKDPNTNNAYILLEGENSRKVEVGDRLIVKADSAGPAQNCNYVTVLEKEAKPRGFLQIPSILDPSIDIEVPAGVYIKINPNNISLVQDELSYITQKATGTTKVPGGGAGTYPLAAVLVNRFDSVTSAYVDYDIPSGSRITLNFKFERIGPGDGNRDCEKRIYTLTKTLFSSSDYPNFKAWWDGDNVELILDEGIEIVGAGGCAIGNSYDGTLYTYLGPGSPAGAIIPDYCINKYRFARQTSDNALYLVASGTRACGKTDARTSTVSLAIDVFRAESALIFETEPSDTLPDVYFENDLSFAIGPNGEHTGNVQNQNFTTNTSAIVDTQFYNCFAFGNGAESYKIRDSVVGKTFNLGNRVTSVSEQDYKRADRFADITYSGVYNDESNVNKLNEFNLGLLNYKALEDSFGPITVLDGRETDVLVLQEDKVSYVLAGKNLLSDAAAGGALTSVPEVLGTQIARLEEYGNSFNPESYAKWGKDKFFTDAKRGAVLQLRGDSYRDEQLLVVSEAGMRSWFRDMFIQSLGSQKLGGYDPYMTEYVLTNNDISVPTPSPCIGCNTPQVIQFSPGSPKNYCVNLGSIVGPVTITWNISSLAPGAEFIVQATYNGVTQSTGIIDYPATLTVQKNLINPSFVDIELIAIGGAVELQINVSCPQPETVQIVEVVITDDYDSGKFIHAEYGYTNAPYISPITSRLIQFASGTSTPLVSWYNSISGFQGSGSIPLNNTQVTMLSNKINFDDFDFDAVYNSFKWLRTNVVYPNNPVGISNLLAAANTATPILGSSPTYYANFTMPNTTDDILYLIWDLRKPNQVELCYSNIDEFDACCGCTTCDELCSTYRITAPSGGSIEYVDCDTQLPIQADVPAGIIDVCAIGIPTAITGTMTIEFLQCGCP